MPSLCRRRFSSSSALSRLGARRSFAAAAHKPPAVVIPADQLVDEERLPTYKARSYFPARPGEILKDKYRLVSKLGWGTTSTVWLAEVTRRLPFSRRYVVVKLCNCDIAEQDRWSEAEMNKHLSTASMRHKGRSILGTALDAFDVESPRGNTHLALVFAPLREPLWLFRRRISDDNLSFETEDLPLLKTYIQILLEGLDYMHSQCHVVHTDLKLDNIMMTFEDSSTVDAYVAGQAENPMARKKGREHTVYRCHNDFGPVFKNLGKMVPNITDFGLAQRADKVPVLLHPIQPDEYRAPEVMLGLGWSYSADMWNFGLVIWEFLAGEPLFPRQSGGHSYSAGRHLADMISLLGDVPPAIAQREKDMRHWRWTPESENPQDKLCNNAADFYGGPFFNDDAKFVHEDLVVRSLELESRVPRFLRQEEEEAAAFLRFIRRMLCWTPEARATASELINDPWLGPCGWR